VKTTFIEKARKGKGSWSGERELYGGGSRPDTRDTAPGLARGPVSKEVSRAICKVAEVTTKTE